MRSLLLLAVLLVADGTLAGSCWNITDDGCSWTPSLVLKGGLIHLGDFYRCLDELQQQYCVAKLRLYPGDAPSPLWDAIQESNRVKTHFRRDLVRWGVCVPRGLGAAVVGAGLQASLSSAAAAEGLRVDVTVTEEDCQASDAPPVDTADLVVGGIILFLVLMVAVASIAEAAILRLKKGSSKTRGLKVLLAFSVISNWKRLSYLGDQNLRPIQGIRFLNMCLIIMGHYLMLIQAGPVQNPEFIEESFNNVGRMVLFNGHVVTTTFFIISGFLFVVIFLQKTEKLKTVNPTYVLMAIVTRLIRLSVPYALVLAVASTLVRHLGRGPLWQQFVGWDVDNCRAHWWANVLYVNNYVHADDTCLLHSWYLAADTQLFLVGLVLSLVVRRWPRCAVALLSTCLGVATLVPMLQTYALDLDPALLAVPEVVRNVTYDRTFLYSYEPTHMNAAPYMAGLLFGYIFHLFKHDKKAFPVWASAVSWTYMLTVPLASLLAAFVFYQPWYVPYRGVSAVLGGLLKTLWALGLGIFICLSGLGQGLILRSVVSWKPFQPLGRLTFCAYLVHFTIQKTILGLLDHEVRLTEVHVVKQWISQVAQAYLLGLVLCLAVEMPTNALWNMLLPSSGSPNNQDHTQRQRTPTIPEDSKVLNGVTSHL